MNELREIPDSIGHTLRLNANAIVKLPEKSKQMKIGGDLHLRCNHLTDIGAAFLEDMCVHGHVLYNYMSSRLCLMQSTTQSALH